MKITFFSADPGNHRFIQPIIDRLAMSGIECQLLNNWTHTDADVYWFDFCDNNLIVASRDDKEELKKKKVIARLHAIEFYLGFHHAIDWSTVGDLIFVSDHLRRLCGYLPVRSHTIHNGIDLAHMAFRERQHGLNLAYAGNIVPAKGIITMFHYFRELRHHGDYRLRMVGLNRFSARDLEFYKYYTKDLPIDEAGEVPNIDAWLEDVNYLWQPSHAESFSMIIGEAMAKGIKPLINNFYGADELWPTENIYVDFTTFYDIIKSTYDSKKYREFVKKYSLDLEMEKIKKLL